MTGIWFKNSHVENSIYLLSLKNPTVRSKFRFLPIFAFNAPLFLPFLPFWHSLLRNTEEPSKTQLPLPGDVTSKNFSQALEACLTPSQNASQDDSATKALNSESMEKAMVKNSLTEWVEPKHVKIPFQKLHWDLHCEYGQVRKRDPQLVAARLDSLKQYPPHRHLECIVWRSPGALYIATAV